MKREWYCYICGKKILKSYHLFSMEKNTDRVFLVCEKKRCVDQICPHDMILIKVTENI